jgi:hypothetical protein
VKAAQVAFESIASHVAAAAEDGFKIHDTPASTWFELTTDDNEFAGFGVARTSRPGRSAFVLVYLLEAFRGDTYSFLITDCMCKWGRENDVGELVFQVQRRHGEWVLRNRPGIAYVIARASNGTMVVGYPTRMPLKP